MNESGIFLTKRITRHWRYTFKKGDGIPDLKNNFESASEFKSPTSSLPITKVEAADIANKQLEIVRFLEEKGIEKDFTAINLSSIIIFCSERFEIVRFQGRATKE